MIYLAVAIAYCLRRWSLRPAVLVIVGTAVLTTILTLRGVLRGSESAAELVEIPVMSLMLLAIVLHLEGRQKAARLAAVAEERERVLEHGRRFFSSASHELKTPLTIARGHLELLGRDGPPDMARVAEVRSVVLDELTRMQDLVGDLLLLGRLDEERAVELELIDVAELVDRANDRWAALHPDRFRVESGAEGMIAAELPALERAVANLVENALRHTGPNDSVVLRTTADRDVLRITVEDTGEGIPQDALPHVCERFVRAGSSRSRGTGRAGLGLAIVKAVVEAHGGELEIASWLGEGTRVTITLPGLDPAGHGHLTGLRPAA